MGCIKSRPQLLAMDYSCIMIRQSSRSHGLPSARFSRFRACWQATLLRHFYNICLDLSCCGGCVLLINYLWTDDTHSALFLSLQSYSRIPVRPLLTCGYPGRRSMNAETILIQRNLQVFVSYIFVACRNSADWNSL